MFNKLRLFASTICLFLQFTIYSFVSDMSMVHYPEQIYHWNGCSDLHVYILVALNHPANAAGCYQNKSFQYF